MAELARKKVEMKYAKLESEKKIEIERKRCEMEEIERLKQYKTAKAEADAMTRIEEQERNPNLTDFKEFQMNNEDKEKRVHEFISSLSSVSSHQLPLSGTCGSKSSSCLLT